MNQKYILLIEDNKGISDSLIWAIEYENHRVIPKFNGQEAMDYLNLNPEPSLILLDMMMPIMNGEKFRALQHSTPRLAKIPTVLMSAKNELKKSVSLFSNESLLAKPFDVNKLLKIINEAMIK